MNDLPRQKLCEIITHYDQSLKDNPGRCEGLLRDVCRGEHHREVFVLMSALKQGVAAELLASQNSVPHELLLARLTRRLHDNLTLVEDAARWAVESWALALGVISSSQSRSPSPPPRVPTQYELKSTLTGHSDSVNSVTISPDGQTLVSGSADNTIKIWRMLKH